MCLCLDYVCVVYGVCYGVWCVYYVCVCIWCVGIVWCVYGWYFVRHREESLPWAGLRGHWGAMTTSRQLS